MNGYKNDARLAKHGLYTAEKVRIAPNRRGRYPLCSSLHRVQLSFKGILTKLQFRRVALPCSFKDAFPLSYPDVSLEEEELSVQRGKAGLLFPSALLMYGACYTALPLRSPFLLKNTPQAAATELAFPMLSL